MRTTEREKQLLRPIYQKLHSTKAQSHLAIQPPQTRKTLTYDTTYTLTLESPNNHLSMAGCTMKWRLQLSSTFYMEIIKITINLLYNLRTFIHLQYLHTAIIIEYLYMLSGSSLYYGHPQKYLMCMSLLMRCLFFLIQETIILRLHFYQLTHQNKFYNKILPNLSI